MTIERPTTKLLFCLAVGSIAGSIGLVLDILLLSRGMPKLGILLLSNLITGALAGTLLLRLKIWRMEKRRVIEDRLSTIADMNHHVRNALAVVAYYGTEGANATRAQLVSQAVKRIEWALREILPRGWNMSEGHRQDDNRSLGLKGGPSGL
jgi:hypothetical protein